MVVKQNRGLASIPAKGKHTQNTPQEPRADTDFKSFVQRVHDLPPELFEQIQHLTFSIAPGFRDIRGRCKPSPGMPGPQPKHTASLSRSAAIKAHCESLNLLQVSHGTRAICAQQYYGNGSQFTLYNYELNNIQDYEQWVEYGGFDALTEWYHSMPPEHQDLIVSIRFNLWIYEGKSARSMIPEHWTVKEKMERDVKLRSHELHVYCSPYTKPIDVVYLKKGSATAWRDWVDFQRSRAH